MNKIQALPSRNFWFKEEKHCTYNKGPVTRLLGWLCGPDGKHGLRAAQYTGTLRLFFPLLVIIDSLWPGASVKVLIINIRFLFVAELWNSVLAKYFKVPKEIPWGTLWRGPILAKTTWSEIQCLAKDPLWVKYGKCSPVSSVFYSLSLFVSPLPHFPWPFGSF